MLYFLVNLLFKKAKPAGVKIRNPNNFFTIFSFIFMDLEYAKYLLEKTKEDYNLIAEDFSRTRSVVWEELKLLKEYILEKDRILDLGCGNGRLLQILEGKNIEYFGIDNSEELIKIARGKYPDRNFQVADILILPFSDNFFDKVYSIAVLHHIPSEEFRLQVLNEIRRVLKPGGLLILTVWDFWRKEALALIFKYFFFKLIGKSKLDFRDIFLPWGNKTERYYHYFTKKELLRLMERVGFIIKKIGVAKNETGKRSNVYLVAQKLTKAKN